jgi:hypothetical protein
VRFVLVNPALNGTSRYGNKSKTMETVYTPEVLPKVLSDDEWAALQLRVGVRSQHKGPGRPWSSRYLLTGILKCAWCKTPMTGRQGPPYKNVKGQLVYYPGYWCAAWQRSTALCSHSNGHSTRKLEPLVFSELRKYADPKAVRALLAPPVSPLPALAAQMKRLQRQLEKIDQGFLQDRRRLDSGVFDERDFMQSNTERRAERETLERELEALKPVLFEAYVVDKYEQLIPRQVTDVLAQVEDGALPIPRAKTLLAALVKAIYVKKDDEGKIELEIEFRIDESAA